tara:strand:- start:3367 stop:3675 length:309 start_codon:yes stop_codon:yes gene_type:complete
MSPRPKKDYIDVHRAADKFEPQLERRFLNAAKEMKNVISIDDFTQAIARAQFDGVNERKIIDAIMRLLPLSDLKEILAPIGTVTKEAFMKGGRLGAKQVRDA